jgi:hypothetical protein
VSSAAQVGIFGREVELALLRTMIASRLSFLLHGPAGVGKTLLLRTAVADRSDVLYSATNKSPQSLLRALADRLYSLRNRTTLKMLGAKAPAALSAVAMKGVVLESIRSGSYIIVLDQLTRPSQAVAAVARELSRAGAAVISAARSAHMEDAGYLLPQYPFKEQKVGLKNFEPKIGGAFISLVANAIGLEAENRQELFDKILTYSEGNPGAIEALLRKAGDARYRLGNHVKIAPLYIDFRLEWNALA